LLHPLGFVVLNRPSELVAVADLVAVACTGGFHGGGFGSGTRGGFGGDGMHFGGGRFAGAGFRGGMIGS
jgi:hypothetical protein